MTEKIMVTPALLDDFIAFRNHCILIRRDYNTYNALYFSGADELLLKAACTFFNEIADLMQKNWILQVCKIMDNESAIIKGVKYETISIKLINKRLEDESLLTTQIESIANEILSYGNILLPVRHKIIAHLDRHHTLNGVALGEHSHETLDKFLCDIQNYCDEVGRAIGEGPLDFSSSSCDGDAYSLLKVLQTHFEDGS